MIPFEEPLSLPVTAFGEYEDPVAGFGVVEIVDIEDLGDPLIGTDGIEWGTIDLDDFLALFLVLRFAVERLALFFILRLALLFLAEDFFTAFFFAAT
jgi:hypothetical protein